MPKRFTVPIQCQPVLMQTKAGKWIRLYPLTVMDFRISKTKLSLHMPDGVTITYSPDTDPEDHLAVLGFVARQGCNDDVDSIDVKGDWR